MRKSTSQAAGGDMRAHAIGAGVPNGAAQQRVRTCGTYPTDLQTLADWWGARVLQTVALEATGVSWRPRFEACAACGRPCGWISAASITRGLGRKSVLLACQWMQPLHRAGRRPASWRPAADLVAWRPLWRQRAPAMPARAHILRRPGVGRVAVPGMREAIAQTMGPRWGPTCARGPMPPFCSGLGRAPTHDIAGGQGLQRRPRNHRRRAPHAFRMAAQAVTRSPCACGACSRRRTGRRGPAPALVATAHQSARPV
jgi:hypothetical protein